jgi:hypothetical protein
MHLVSFFEHIKETKDFPEGKVFCFFGFGYPLLFFYHLIAFFKKNNVFIETLNCADDISSVKALLSTMSFSGETTYWLEGFSALSEKKQQDMLQYIQVYSGPHRIFFFSDKIPAHSNNVIELPKNITAQLFMAIRFLISDHLSDKSDFSAQISMYADYLCLDSICLLTHYELLVGKSIDDFFSQWITRIIDPISSSFVLSQHLFGKKSKSFFRQWAVISEQHAPTFWASFWADQIWRAYLYTDLMQQKKYVDAKKVQYKLPFSFINRDWSSYNLVELRNAHHFLTTIDFKLKNGGSEIALEHFYTQFFDNKFR